MKLLRLIPRFRRAYRSLEILSTRETWSRENIEQLQLERVNRLWRQAIQHVAYYRELRNEFSLPSGFRTLEEFSATVPVLPKPELRANPKAFVSAQCRPGRWFRSGGSTGSPMQFYWAKDAHLEVLQSKYRFYSSWGIDPLDRCAFLWGHDHVYSKGWRGYVGRWKQRVSDSLRGRLRLSAYHLSPQDLELYLIRLRSFRPAMLYGFSRAVHLLAEHAKAREFACPSLKLIVLSSEVAWPHMIDTIEEAFSAPAAIEYGACECPLIAGQSPDKTLRVREDIVFVETAPRTDGRFDILLTVLNNPSFPLIRYAIGDITDEPVMYPERGFAALANVAGRQDDFIVTRTGKRLHPTLIDAVFEEASDNVHRYRVHQEADGTLVASIERLNVNRPLDTAVHRDLLAKVSEGLPVRIEIVSQIPLTAAGKHRAITSECVGLGSAMPSRVANH